ncbi:uncharacterized protein LOC143616394 [Bidens hawaiensis]|uniref:uncharacterized protein LOC143616394 n=1 Tax=Bidens hawaiensis TaxID=980011 RepID=UPI00404998BB
MIPVSSSWPFQKWGIDIVGPFPEGTRKAKFLVVAIDYFTKWVEAKPLRTITGEQVKRFVWESIVCRFGLPYAIISDNGKQFANNPFQEWCLQLKIKQTFTSVAHPQVNDQVERANRSVVEGIKARLGRETGSWVEELPHVLWAHRTMPKTSNGETPFSLTYGTEAMIPAEIGVPTRRTLQKEKVGGEDLWLNLNLAEERREEAARREVEYKKNIERYYNARVREVKFKTGDLVFRENEASRQEDQGNWALNGKGPTKLDGLETKGPTGWQTWEERRFPRHGTPCNSESTTPKGISRKV